MFDVTRPRRWRVSRSRRLCRICLPLGLSIAAAACGGSANQAAGGDPGSHCGVSRTVIAVLETGAAPTPGVLDRLGEAADSALSSGGGFRAIDLTGPDANVAADVTLPGLDADGCLKTHDGNPTARRQSVEQALPAVLNALAAAFDEAPSFDNGRDLTGAIARAGEAHPAEIILVTTSGGVHRTSDADFLQSIPAQVELQVPESTAITLIGIGRVPMAAGTTNKALTDALLAAWHAGCDPNPRCRVVS